MARINHREIQEGDLHSLSDDHYFEALKACPTVYDADGHPVAGLFDDVQDKRAEKNR